MPLKKYTEPMAYLNTNPNHTNRKHSYLIVISSNFCVYKIQIVKMHTNGY